MVQVVQARCMFDPTTLGGLPLGQLHCPECGCMVIAGMQHGPCFEPDCQFYDAEFSEQMDREYAAEHAAAQMRMFGLLKDCSRCVEARATIGDEKTEEIIFHLMGVVKPGAVHALFHDVPIPALGTTAVHAIEEGRVADVLAWARRLEDPSFS
jgi:hypothetical protein